MAASTGVDGSVEPVLLQPAAKAIATRAASQAALLREETVVGDEAVAIGVTLQ